MQTNLISIDAWTNKEATLRRQLANGGGGGDNGDMETRLAKIEAALPTLATKADLHPLDLRLVKIEAYSESIAKHYATKSDVSDAKTSIIIWVVSAILLAQLLPALLKKFGG